MSIQQSHTCVTKETGEIPLGMQFCSVEILKGKFPRKLPRRTACLSLLPCWRFYSHIEIANSDQYKPVTPGYELKELTFPEIKSVLLNCLPRPRIGVLHFPHAGN